MEQVRVGVGGCGILSAWLARCCSLLLVARGGWGDVSMPLFKYLRILNPVIHYMTATEHIRQPNRHKFELLPILEGQTFARLTPNWKIIKCWLWQLPEAKHYHDGKVYDWGRGGVTPPGKLNAAEDCPWWHVYHHRPAEKTKQEAHRHLPKIHNYYPAANGRHGENKEKKIPGLGMNTKRVLVYIYMAIPRRRKR